MTTGREIARTSVFARHPDASYRVVDDEAVVLLPEGSAVHVLNEVGARVWELLDGRRSVESIIEALGEEYEVSPEEVASDVTEFMGALVEKEMVVATP